ncbi:EBNA-1 nuclear protein [Vibrio vulnificus]|uniref:DUF1611 domain-containing protein n=1 Tax=Vibrio vulnificus TaxID=672 RepID=UPI00031656AC|nr:DUF1611 domain-containing protein [Vibrio vulnificus]QBH29568.1 Protein often near L-alanine-DL-glutamate epimerase (cell wall recycling) [Vibrio vulnificus]QBN17170.1 DUF1611 domain-containing protein [Vibrio vulnificus]HAS6200262.1 DUF1611 domain-containing protein [Vibrio vulnificus]HAS6355640.1 DUF1611 domain-containing protein [Vibrio vulnificus]HDY7604207.1 DUF1611 domain-containing protein [Vibrio vulnificus]
MSISTRKLRNIFQLTRTEHIKNDHSPTRPEPWTPLCHKVNPTTPTAIIYCEGNFGKTDGKTANGLVRHSPNYRILSVIDSELSGSNSGEILDGKKNTIPIFSDLEEALRHTDIAPSYFIFGIAPSNGLLSDTERDILLKAMSCHINIIIGLHEFLTEDPVFIEASLKYNVHIVDVRKPKNNENMQSFSGKIHQVKCPRIAVMGTDCALGKRTTATILTNELRNKGLNVVMIATGQTGIMQGAPYGVALDAVSSFFCAGELEAVIVKAYENENPDIIIIEGQGALSHQAFSTSSHILRGCCPTAVILQHAPKRAYRVDFPELPIPSVAYEINLIQAFSDTTVIGLTLNHEGLSSDEILSAISAYSAELGLPVTDPLSQPKEHLLQMIFSAYPLLENTRAELR